MSKSAHSIATEKIEANFIEGPNGLLFCIFASSKSTTASVGGSTQSRKLLHSDHMNEVRNQNIVLFVPPFGEENNLCRRFYSLLRTRLSSAGLLSLQPDLYGTGDSAGSFEEATWEMWQSDLECVIDQFCLPTEGNDVARTLSIVAVRTGCLLAQQLLASSRFLEGYVELNSIIFIQPELDGFEIVNQLFRTRITAQRFSGDKTQTTADLWACIARRETVHAGGYALSSELCRVLQHTCFDLGSLTSFKRQVLFELETYADGHESAGWEKICMSAKPFWRSYDIEPEAALVNAVAETIGCRHDSL